jgi:hypothetical protein
LTEATLVEPAAAVADDVLRRGPDDLLRDAVQDLGVIEVAEARQLRERGLHALLDVGLADGLGQDVLGQIPVGVGQLGDAQDGVEDATDLAGRRGLLADREVLAERLQHGLRLGSGDGLGVVAGRGARSVPAGLERGSQGVELLPGRTAALGDQVERLGERVGVEAGDEGLGRVLGLLAGQVGGGRVEPALLGLGRVGRGPVAVSVVAQVADVG